MLSNLNHPNVLRFYGVVVESQTEPNVIGIMTEYMKGGSLSAFLRCASLQPLMHCTSCASMFDRYVNGIMLQNGAATDACSLDTGDCPCSVLLVILSRIPLLCRVTTIFWHATTVWSSSNRQLLHTEFACQAVVVTLQNSRMLYKMTSNALHITKSAKHNKAFNICQTREHLYKLAAQYRRLSWLLTCRPSMACCCQGSVILRLACITWIAGSTVLTLVLLHAALLTDHSSGLCCTICAPYCIPLCVHCIQGFQGPAGV